MNILTQLSRAKNSFAIIVVGILLFAAATRLFRLSWPANFYFDEVYHGFTATTYLHNDPKGYEYWQTPPEGVAYEWTHPPLAKILMAGSMKVAGENSIGWRLSSVVFGTAVIGMTGAIAHQLFGRKQITLIAMVLTSLDGLLISMSRLAMNDMHFLFFALSGVFFYIRFRRVHFVEKEFNSQVKFLAFSALCIGLALASKWTALYVGAAIGLDFWLAMIAKWKFPVRTICAAIIVYGCIVPSTYLFSYTQFFMQGHSFTQFKETQQQMWWYHTGLKATHGYQSRPWQWVLDLRPVWMHVDYSQNDNKRLAHIYNVGNPLVFWFGAASMLIATGIIGKSLVQTSAAWLSEKKSTKPVKWELFFIVLLYFAMWLPWQFSPRIMFFYHYAPALPWLATATAYVLTKTYRVGQGEKVLILAVLLLVFFAFVILYPLNTGYFMPSEYFDRVFSLFPMWK